MMGRRRRCRQGTRSRCGDGRRRGRGRAAVAVAADGEDDDDEPLAGPAPRRVGADEEVGSGVVEDEAGVAAVEPLGWLRGVAGVVVALAHQQHGVRVLAVPEHEGVVDLEPVALRPGVEGLGGVGRPAGAAADVEVAAGGAGRRHEHGEQVQSRHSSEPPRHPCTKNTDPIPPMDRCGYYYIY